MLTLYSTLVQVSAQKKLSKRVQVDACDSLLKILSYLFFSAQSFQLRKQSSLQPLEVDSAYINISLLTIICTSLIPSLFISTTK